MQISDPSYLAWAQRFKDPPEPPEKPPAGRGGGDGDNDPMERIARLETKVEAIERGIGELHTDVRGLRQDIGSIRTTDFRITFGAIITVALGLAALMAKGFGWL